MKTYLYPQNLKAKANLWFWNLRDFLALSILALIAVVVMVNFDQPLPTALSLCYGFLTIRADDTAVADHLGYAARFLLTSQQYYEWRLV